MSYVRVTYPKFQAIKSDGTPAIGYKVYTYDANTTDAATTYSNRALSSANSNPIILDSRGECDIYTSSSIKLVLKTAADVEVWTVDYVAEQQSTFLSGSATAGTTNNAYAIAFTPTLSALSNNLMVVWTPDTDNTDTVGTQSFTGTGPNDCVISGPYSGSTGGSVFQIAIDDATSNPNTFKWRKDSESYTTGVAITGGDQSLKEGISVNFAVLSGHVLNDLWAVTVQKPATLNADGLGAKLIYKNIGGALALIDGGDIQEDYPATCVYSSAQDCWVLNNPSDPVYESAQRDLIRTVTAADYTLAAADHGTEISFTNATAKTLTLPAAATFADMFVDIRASGAGTVTFDADGTEVIYSKKSPAGAGTYVMSGGRGDNVRLTTNGVDWHILAETIRTVSIQTFTSSGSYTHSDGTNTILVVTRAPGGGGAGANGGGGGGGGYGVKYLAVTSLTEPETVTINAAGTGGGAGSDGTDGGTVSFGAHVSATGGKKGIFATGVGGVGGTGVGGHINGTGEAGGDWGGTPDGTGGASFGIHGGARAAKSANGNTYGGGGGASGGNGAAGICVVYEFPGELAYMAQLLSQLLGYAG